MIGGNVVEREIYVAHETHLIQNWWDGRMVMVDHQIHSRSEIFHTKQTSSESQHNRDSDMEHMEQKSLLSFT